MPRFHFKNKKHNKKFSAKFTATVNQKKFGFFSDTCIIISKILIYCHSNCEYKTNEFMFYTKFPNLKLKDEELGKLVFIMFETRIQVRLISMVFRRKYINKRFLHLNQHVRL